MTVAAAAELAARQTSTKESVLRNDNWDVHTIADAFDNHLLAALEPPPSVRRTR